MLQEGEFEPVGSSKMRSVDVRVLAATNRHLLQMVADGQFREDLYYRLAVFPIHVPLLASTFMQQAARRLGRRVPELTAGVIARLQAYDWPGNVRELQNVIEWALITATGNGLNLDRVLLETAATAGVAEPEWEIRTRAEMVELERANILRALDDCDFRVSGTKGAAARLGRPPSTLSSRMKSLGIERSKRRWPSH